MCSLVWGSLKVEHPHSCSLASFNFSKSKGVTLGVTIKRVNELFIHTKGGHDEKGVHIIHTLGGIIKNNK